MTVEPGQRLGGLVLRHKIAEGGMGTIWAAEHPGLGREVAVKFLAAHTTDQLEAIHRFTHEARTLARISSPCVPQVFDFGVTAEGTHYIVMELVAGTEVGEWIKERGLMSAAQAGRLLEQTALALAAAHQLGVIHRDIKPENIMLSGGPHDFHVKVVDFGIAKSPLSRALGYSTLVGATIGTPKYMSPEQLTGGTVDSRSDMWSLAVVIYWCLTGRAPFDGDDSLALYVAIEEGRARPVSEFRPDLPLSLDEWFARALAFEPSRRFESVEVMSHLFTMAGASTVYAERPTPDWNARTAVRPSHKAIETSFAEVTRVEKMARAGRRRARPVQVAVVAAGLGLLVASGGQLAAGSRLNGDHPDRAHANAGGPRDSGAIDVLAPSAQAVLAASAPHVAVRPAPAPPASPMRARTRRASRPAVDAPPVPLTTPASGVDKATARAGQSWSPSDLLGEP